MTTQRDPDRLIRAFLDEGRTQLPDRTYDAIRSDIERTRQRVAFDPWRLTRMNSYLRYAIAAAAVVIVAIIGINVLPGVIGQSVGPSATPSPSPSPTPTAVPTPSPTTAGFAPRGGLARGRHTFTSGGLRFSVDIQTAGWISNGSYAIDWGPFLAAESAEFIFWPDAAAVGIFADPCSATKGPSLGTSLPDLAAAVAALPGTDVVEGPTDVTVGGYPAKRVAITIREDIACPPDKFFMWYGPGSNNERYASALGATFHTWIVDVNGTIAWIDGETYKGSGPEQQQLLQDVVDSIQFE